MNYRQYNMLTKPPTNTADLWANFGTVSRDTLAKKDFSPQLNGNELGANAIMENVIQFFLIHPYCRPYLKAKIIQLGYTQSWVKKSLLLYPRCILLPAKPLSKNSVSFGCLCCLDTMNHTNVAISCTHKKWWKQLCEDWQKRVWERKVGLIVGLSVLESYRNCRIGSPKKQRHC